MSCPVCENCGRDDGALENVSSTGLPWEFLCGGCRRVLSEGEARATRAIAAWLRLEKNFYRFVSPVGVADAIESSDHLTTPGASGRREK